MFGLAPMMGMWASCVVRPVFEVSVHDYGILFFYFCIVDLCNCSKILCVVTTAWLLFRCVRVTL